MGSSFWRNYKYLGPFKVCGNSKWPIISPFKIPDHKLILNWYCEWSSRIKCGLCPFTCQLCTLCILRKPSLWHVDSSLHRILSKNVGSSSIFSSISRQKFTLGTYWRCLFKMLCTVNFAIPVCCAITRVDVERSASSSSSTISSRSGSRGLPSAWPPTPFFLHNMLCELS